MQAMPFEWTTGNHILTASLRLKTHSLQRQDFEK